MSHTLTEGGQITSHRLRMLKQVIKIALFSSVICGFVLFSFLMIAIPKIYYIALWYNFKAVLCKDIFSQIKVDHNFLTGISQIYYHQDQNLAPDYVKKITNPFVTQFIAHLTASAFKALTVSLVASAAILSFFLYKGKKSKKEIHLSGLKVSQPLLLSWKIKFCGKASKIHIGKIPLIKGFETRHMMITGGTGSGKTNCLFHLLKQIQLNQQKSIIIDTNGTFVEKYFRPGKDIILNPFDERTEKWSPWAEGKSNFDYADLAESFIPTSKREQESYWRESAKTVFTSLLEKCSDVQSTSELVRWLQYEPLTSLCKLLEKTAAAAHMDLASEKTASSVRSVASTFLTCLRSLEDTSHSFSIRDWIGREDDSWLFLQCTTKQRAFLRPLMTAWISAAIRGLIALPVDLERRIWFVIDELPSLQRVKDLETLLTEGRKYGGCGIMVLQTPAQIEEIYGREVSQVMTANTATKIVFQEEDSVIAERISRAFGEREISERQEGISYGAHEMRDGVSLSMQKRSKPIITPTEIMQLQTNTAFVKLPSGNGITKIKLPIFL